jgi:SAM-dependent methyltransferase
MSQQYATQSARATVEPRTQVPFVPSAEVNRLGERLLDIGRAEEARLLFEMAVGEEPSCGQYSNNLAVARFQTGDLPGAMRGMEHAIGGQGDHRLFTLNFADLARTRPRFLRRGIEHCRAYLETAGPDEQVAAALAQLESDLQIADASFAAAVTKMPHHALMKVNGSAEAAHFVQMGKNIVSDLLGHFGELRRAETVLDFGVGLGRVLWPLTQELPGARFIGFDVDPMMLGTIARIKEFEGVDIVATTHDIPDNTVDATYVISVFTHLDHTTDYWLWELNRVLKPGGRAFVTYHDETLYDKIRNKTPETRDFKGRTILGAGAEGSTRVATFYETAEWERTVGRFFRVVRTAPRGLHGHQSFSILEKGDATVDALGLHRTYVKDLERELFEMRAKANLEY